MEVEMGMKKKILFICETVTMAHLMRSKTLIQGLDQKKYSIYLAAGSIPAFVKSELEKLCTLLPLESSIESALFLKHLAKGTLPYTDKVVEAQVINDIKLIEDVNPDLVVGDFRLSLAISAKVKNIPYINISNATWHPRVLLPVLVPDLKIVRLFGEKWCRQIFKLIRPSLYRKLALPYVRVAKKFGQLVPTDIQSLYVSGDYTFYSDSASLVRVPNLEKNHFVAGPILSSLPGGNFTDPFLGSELPRVIISLGSSGELRLTEKLVDILKNLPVNFYVATGGANYKSIENLKNVHAADFLPLETLLKKTQLLICNGGSASGYLSLSNGVPFVAIPSNLDQFNFTELVCQKGAAIQLRIEKMNSHTLTKTVQMMLANDSYTRAAMDIKASIRKENANGVFSQLVTSTLQGEII